MSFAGFSNDDSAAAREKRYQQNLAIAACDVYTDPSTNEVIDALNNDDEVRMRWARLVNCEIDDSEQVLASSARQFIQALEVYIKSCPAVIRRAERLSQ